MRHLRLILLILTLVHSIARAHVGFENDTEIRVFPDHMRMVIRTSVPFAQALLGYDIPSAGGEAGQPTTPLPLEKPPADLISITAGGETVLPNKAQYLSEVQDDIAFILTYARPAAWPVVVKAEFFPRFGNLESGTLSVFDCTASRFSRDVEPLMKKIIDARDPMLSFSLIPTDQTGKEGKKTSPAGKAEPSTLDKTMAIGVFTVAAGAIVLLARRSWRGLGGKA